MRNVEAHLLEDKMDEAVTHYINSHQPPESVHVDANSLALNVQDDTGGRVVTVMHPQNFPPQMCRQVSVVEGAWVEDLLDPESRLAALVAHLAEHSRSSHHIPHGHSKVPIRSDVDASVILDAPMRLFNGQTLEHQQESIVVEVPPLPPLPPLQDMKRCPETDWFSKDKGSLKDDQQILGQNSQVLDMGASQKQHSKKSLPHKKRISRKLKRNGCSTPQQDIVVINCNEEVQQEEILPDNFVAAVQHPDMPEDTHHISHEMRALFICQICGEFYGDEQLKFYQHLKHHYEPAITIIENPVPDLGIDKMTNTCIVDNVPTLPDSIVELSLENTVPKTMYQPIDKHILYTSSDKTLSYNTKVYQTIDKEVDNDKSDIYRDLDKLEMYFCAKCNKTFRKQKQYEAHLNEAHSNSKIEEMNEFSEPEDLMEGIHVAVEEGEAYEHVLPHLTVENGHVHQEHVRQWYLRNTASPPPAAASPLCACGGAGFCATCACAPLPPPPPAPPSAPAAPAPPASPAARDDKEESLHRIFEQDQQNDQTFTSNETQTQNQNQTQTQSIGSPIQVKTEPGIEPKNSKKKGKTFKCLQCDKVFSHKNSLLYHELMHDEKKEVCRDCGKKFYTVGALKVHKRMHNGDRPCKCDECGREFRQWSDLKYHKASLHSSQKEYKCDFCGKEFARRYSLNIHRRIHTGERKYKCDYCSKTFRASSYRLSHMRIHTGCKPYKCTYCDKSFRVTYDLRRHMAIHEKARIIVDDTKKNKDNNDKKTITMKPNETKHDKNNFEDKKETPRLPVLRTLLDKKVTLPKKSPKKVPNVTIQNRDFKINDYELLERQEQYKFKEVYTQKDVYTEEMRLDRNEDRDLGLRLKNQNEDDRLAYRENTDGKMHVYTQIDKTKDYEGPIVTNTVSLSDLRNLDKDVREPRTELHGESIENGFFERLSAFYNIPAV